MSKNIEDVVKNNTPEGKRLKNGIIQHLATLHEVSYGCIQDAIYRRWSHV